MERITEKQLEAVARRINAVTNSPEAAYTRTGDNFEANIGNYHLSHAYGGVSLHRMVGKGGGVTDVFGRGHMPKRELFDLMHAFLRGFDVAKAA